MSDKRDSKGCKGVLAECDHIREEMNEALRSKLDSCLKWFKDENTRTIVNRWHLGEEIREVYEDEKKGNGQKFGKDSIKRLSFFFREDPSVLRQSYYLAKAYTKNQVEELANTVMSDGVTRISYSHLRQLISLATEEQREEALKAALCGCFTSAQLGEYIHKKYGGKQDRGAGRKPAIPKTANEVISQQLQFVDDFESRNAKVWNDKRSSLSTRVDELDPEDYNEQLVKKLTELAYRMRILEKEAGERAEEAEAKLEQVKKALKNPAMLVKSKFESEEDDDDTFSEYDKALKRARSGKSGRGAKSANRQLQTV